MKKRTIKQYTVLSGLIITLLFSVQTTDVQAQDVSVGADIVSTYVWRGVSYAGPSIQPYVEFSTGGFAIGAWGSQGYGTFTSTDDDGNTVPDSDGFQEMDLYAGYSVAGFYIGVTDYYYPPSNFLDFEAGVAHTLEINLAYEINNIGLSANVIPREDDGAAGETDMYFEASYSFPMASVALGAGNGWHTSSAEFGLVNIAISSDKEIAITDEYSLPVFGSVIVNPYDEHMYIVAGFSF